jgi:hypothetical protein
MARLFFLQKHGCPECGGFVEWLAAQCQYCGHHVSFTDRCEWSESLACTMILLVTAGAGSLIGQTNSWFPTQIAAMAIAVAISMWYLKHTSWDSGCGRARLARRSHT